MSNPEYQLVESSIGQVERCGGIHDSRIIELEHRRDCGSGPGREERMFELHPFFTPVDQFHGQVVCVDNLRQPLQVLDLPGFDELSGSTRQALDDVILEGAQLTEIDFGFGKRNAPGGGMARLIDDVRDVQQRFRGDAAAIDANPARVRLRIDERHLQPEVGRQKRPRVATRPSSDDDKLS